MQVPVTPRVSPSPSGLRVAILDVDGAISGHEALRSACDPIVIPARDLHDKLRYWCDRDTLEELRRRVLQHLPTMAGTVLFYGSSDFHNLSYLWISMLDEPVSVIHFDNHTDWVKVPPRKAIHAGSWVRHALDLDHVAKVLQLGVNGDLEMQVVPPTPTGPLTHDFQLFQGGRLETFPHSLQRATYLSKVAVPAVCGSSHAGLVTTRVDWRTILDEGIEAILDEALDRLPTEAVYISIDKDVLRDEDCFTSFYNWQQGTLSLDELVVALDLIRRRKRIVAVDVNGDASPARFAGGPFEQVGKRLFSLKDRKLRAEMFADPRLITLNDVSNVRILASLIEDGSRVDPSSGSADRGGSAPMGAA